MKKVLEVFPGVGCAWMNAAGKTTAEYHGVADRESNTPVTGDTVFPACSISKFITAICVMKLHEQGAVDINYPVNHYLQQWKLRSPEGNESNASIAILPELWMEMMHFTDFAEMIRKSS